MKKGSEVTEENSQREVDVVNMVVPDIYRILMKIYYSSLILTLELRGQKKVRSLLPPPWSKINLRRSWNSSMNWISQGRRDGQVPGLSRFGQNGPYSLVKGPP